MTEAEVTASNIDAVLPPPDPFSRILLMARIVELEQCLIHNDAIRAALAESNAVLTAELTKASQAASRLLAVGPAEVEALFGFVAQWAESEATGAATAEALRASPVMRNAFMLGLKTFVAGKLAALQADAP